MTHANSGSKITLVVGASTNPDRYAYKAIKSLLQHGHEVIGFGIKKGSIDDVEFINDWPISTNIDTITLYVNPSLQKQYIPQILATAPKRVIFNPGTENEDFVQQLKENGIQAIEACTLVLLSIGNY
jgi:uncharacterized protein